MSCLGMLVARKLPILPQLFEALLMPTQLIDKLVAPLLANQRRHLIPSYNETQFRRELW